MRSIIVILTVLSILGFGRFLSPAAWGADQSLETPAQLVQLLKAQNFKALEQEITTLLKDKHDKELELNGVYAKLSNLGRGAEAETALALFNAWCAQTPRSHIPFTARGGFYVRYAWKARGGGWADSVTEEGWKLFFARLNLAKQDLETAYELDPEDPNAAGYMVIVARGLNFKRPEMEKWFKRAITADSDNFFAYQHKLEYLKPKWHGSEAEMAEFIAESPPGSPAVFLMIDQYEDRYFEVQQLIKAGKVAYKQHYQDQQALEQIYRLMEQYLKIHPGSTLALNFYAKIATLADDFGLADRLFKQIGDNWIPQCWGNKAYFDKLKNYVKIMLPKTQPVR